MAFVFIFLSKLFLIFVILKTVDATLNCEVNKTMGIILPPNQSQSSNVNCQSELSITNVAWYMKGFAKPLEDKQWTALNCTEGKSNVSDSIFCVHGPVGPPTISGEDNLVAGRPTNLTCTIYNVYPEPNIEWFLHGVGQWFLGPDENITMNASLHTTLDNSSSLFNATSSLSFTPRSQDNGQNLTCNVFPSVANVWTPKNASIQLRVSNDSGQSDEIRVESATSSSLFISWDLKRDNITLRYCLNSTMDSDNVTTSKNLAYPDYREVTDLNGTSYNLTGLEPFQWYNVTLLVGGNAVAFNISSTAPPLPEYYGVFMTFTPQKEKLKITRLPFMNRTLPSDLCFVIIQTRDQIRYNCSNGCCKPGSKFSIEDITGYGLVSSGRGLYSLPSPPMFLNSTRGILDMPHVSFVMGAVLGAAVFILLSSVALLLFLNFICKGFEESVNTDTREGRNVSHEANDHMAYEMIQNGDGAYTALKLGPSHSSTIASENVTFFTRLGSIGRGDFGGVWKGELRSNQSQVNVAIRQIPVQVTESTNVLRAVKVLSELPDQPNVVKCLGYCQEKGSILYEFISGGTLLTHLQTTGVQPQPTYGNLKPKRVRIDEGSLLNLAWQTAKGMQYLASKKVTLFHDVHLKRRWEEDFKIKGIRKYGDIRRREWR
eukprot:XP_011678311.1 PREDICTED: uncharacterized protein LOC100891033 [Strongylocentrotus purpuratus]